MVNVIGNNKRRNDQDSKKNYNSSTASQTQKIVIQIIKCSGQTSLQIFLLFLFSNICKTIFFNVQAKDIHPFLLLLFIAAIVCAQY